MKPTVLKTASMRRAAGRHRGETATAMQLDQAVESSDSLRSRLRQLETENRELRQANEILRRAALYFGIAASRKR